MAVSFSFFLLLSFSLDTARLLSLSFPPTHCFPCHPRQCSVQQQQRRADIHSTLSSLSLSSHEACSNPRLSPHTHNSYLSFSPFLPDLPPTPLSPFVVLQLHSFICTLQCGCGIETLCLQITTCRPCPATHTYLDFFLSPFVFRLSFPFSSLHFSSHHSPSLSHPPSLS